jgi:hypothetical protein
MKQYLEQIEAMRVKLPPLDAGKLKYFAAVMMLIDHMACVFLENAYTADGASLMFSLPHGELADKLLRVAGRQAFPIFCFFLVEGFAKTRSRLRYFVRLLIFAVLSQLPFQRGIFPRGKYFHGNVICTLAIGLLAIWVIDSMKLAFPGRGDHFPERGDQSGGTNAEMSRMLSGFLFIFVSCSSLYGFSRLAAALRTDYSYGGVVMIVLLYLLQKYRITALFVSWAWLSWYNRFELYSAPAFYLLACYNGQRGKQHKYFFYFFYPVHLLILWLLRRHFFGV